MKTILSAFLICLSISSFGQIETFEDLQMGPDSVNDGSSGTQMLILDQFAFPVVWDTAFNYWSGGWAATTSNDSSTRGFAGLYDVANGTVPSGTHYMVGQQASSITVTHFSGAKTRPISLQIALNTYAYHSMKDGDQFAKKFGGDDGTDPDYFILKITALGDGNTIDSTKIALADFRFNDDSEDYIQFDWQSIDLTVFDHLKVNSLIFTLTSSDAGDFGINTPTFYVIDDLQYESNPVGVRQVKQAELNLYPNPSATFVYGQDLTKGYEISDMQGKLIEQGHEMRIDLRSYEPGVYLVRLADGRQSRIVKQ